MAVHVFGLPTNAPLNTQQGQHIVVHRFMMLTGRCPTVLVMQTLYRVAPFGLQTR